MSSDEEDIDSIDDDDEEEEEEEEVVAKPKRRGKKKKATKDPNRPKRNMSAFFLYSNANRERVKEENTEAKFGEIVSFLAAMWRVNFCVA
jgi:high mobility group protein B2